MELAGFFLNRKNVTAILYIFACKQIKITIGEVPEWLNGTDSKSVLRLIRVTGVRIPPSPQAF